MSPHVAESLRAILSVIMGENGGPVYLSEDAPRGLIANIHRALELVPSQVVRGDLRLIFAPGVGQDGPRFVEAETHDGRSLRCGDWSTREDGLCELRITTLPPAEPWIDPAAKESK